MQAKIVGLPLKRQLGDAVLFLSNLYAEKKFQRKEDTWKVFERIF